MNAKRLLAALLAVALLGLTAAAAPGKACTHSCDSWTVVNAPNCRQVGFRQGTCSLCGKQLKEKLPALGHTWEEGEITRTPKCESPGTRVDSCTVCGAKQRVTMPAAGHSWGEWEIQVQPKGINRGRREHRCTVCGKSAKEYFYEEGTLAMGDKGQDVYALNLMLKDLGYLSQPRSDQFTQKTKAGVVACQKQRGEKQSGLADRALRLQLDLRWQSERGIQALIANEWQQHKAEILAEDELLRDWERTRPTAGRPAWGPWRSNGDGTHTGADGKAEACSLTRIPLETGRTIEVCWRCGDRWLQVTDKCRHALADDNLCADNGDGSHTVTLLDETSPLPGYIEDHDYVLLGGLPCGGDETATFICRDCGAQKAVPYAELPAGYAVEHLQPPVVEERCSGIMNLCGRCGRLLDGMSTCEACVYQETRYSTPAELAAFEALHPGTVTEATCCAVETGVCLACGMAPNSRYSQTKPWYTEPHAYVLVNGGSVCTRCGRACPDHAAAQSSLPSVISPVCDTCGLPFRAEEECEGGAHLPAALRIHHSDREDAPDEELTVCTRCGRVLPETE